MPPEYRFPRDRITVNFSHKSRKATANILQAKGNTHSESCGQFRRGSKCGISALEQDLFMGRLEVTFRLDLCHYRSLKENETGL